MSSNHQNIVSLIWNIADLLRGSWKQHEYQDVILPLVVMKRLDCVLQPTKEKVLEKYNQFEGKVDVDPILKVETKVGFYNISPYDFEKLLEDPKHIISNLRNYMRGFSKNVQDILEKFDFDRQMKRLEGGNLLFLIIQQLSRVDLHPNTVDNHEMGMAFEELIRKFAEQSNETAGEHFTARDIIKLMVEILFDSDIELLKKEHVIKTIYDCASGTGGMLTVAKEHIMSQNHKADIYLFGQELNPVTYAVCKSDMLLKGEELNRIKGGERDHAKASTLSNDQFADKTFDYLLTNPPFGVDWKKDKAAVEREASRGYAGRFGAGLPRISDGQLLFLQHMISKMKNPSDGGSRLAIVFNGSPLFSGDAGSGESEIRRWILEHDWLETIVALPDQLFYNTGINTYIWILTNRKSEKRRGKVQLIDARKFCHKMRKSLGNKRYEITPEDRSDIVALYHLFQQNDQSKIFNNTDFGYRQIRVERPLRLNISVTPEHIEQLKNETAFQNLAESKKKGEIGIKEIEEGKRLQDQIVDILSSFGNTVSIDCAQFEKTLTQAFKKADIKLSVALKKGIINALSERDENAEVCTDEKGNALPDADLRDTENIPLSESVESYFDREVRPFASDAWIDESVKDHKDGKVGKIGYEIPLTRYFYTYQPPRPLEEIESDIENVENELLEMMKKLA